MAKPDKTQLINSCIAQSMQAWAKATINLDQERIRTSHPSHIVSVDEPLLDNVARSLEFRTRSSAENTTIPEKGNLRLKK